MQLEATYEAKKLYGDMFDVRVTWQFDGAPHEVFCAIPANSKEEAIACARGHIKDLWDSEYRRLCS